MEMILLSKQKPKQQQSQSQQQKQTTASENENEQQQSSSASETSGQESQNAGDSQDAQNGAENGTEDGQGQDGATDGSDAADEPLARVSQDDTGNDAAQLNYPEQKQTEEQRPPITAVGDSEPREWSPLPAEGEPDGLILEADEEPRFEGKDVEGTNMVEVQQDVYRKVTPAGTLRPSYVKVYSKGTHVPKTALQQK